MTRIYLKKQAEVERMRAAGVIVARVLKALAEACGPGTTTAELDRIAADLIEDAGGQASFLNYRVGDRVYPAHICTSINEEIVHGIPGNRRLVEGDLVGVDVGVYLDGFHADSAATFPVGNISAQARKLLDVTRQSLYAGIKEATVGHRVGHVSAAIQRFAESRGYCIIESLVGHGVGRSLHEDPQVPNFGKPNSGERLVPGMTLAIEPMVSIGTGEVVGRADHWTVATADRSLSAHFEHTVAITRNGPDILTGGF